MKTQQVSMPGESGQGDESPFAGKSKSKGGLSFGVVLSQSRRAQGGQTGAVGTDVGNKVAAEMIDAESLASASMRQGSGEGRAGSSVDRGARVGMPAGKGDELRSVRAAKAGGQKNATRTDAESDAHGAILEDSEASPAKDVQEGQGGLLGASTEKPLLLVQQASAEEDVQQLHESRRAAQAGHAARAGQVGLADSSDGAAGSPRLRSSGAPGKRMRADFGRQTAMTDDAANGAIDGDDDLAAKADATAKSGSGTAAPTGAAAGHEESDAAVTLPARLRATPGKGAFVGANDETFDANAAGDTSAHGRDERKTRHGSSEEIGKGASETGVPLSALQAAGLMDFRMPLLRAGFSDEDFQGGAAAGIGQGDGAGDLAAALRAEIDRAPGGAQATFTLPPPVLSPQAPAPLDAPAPAAVIAAGAALTPAELGMVPDDPALNLAILTRAAHLSLEGQDGRSLELHVRLLPEGAEIRANGELASQLHARASDLSSALAAEGVTLNRFELGQDSRHQAPRDSRPDVDDGEFYRPNSQRAAINRASSTDSVVRTSDGRIHVKA